MLNSAEEKLEEQKTWLEPEDPADNFTDAKEQQDKMKVSLIFKFDTVDNSKSIMIKSSKSSADIEDLLT